MSGSGKTCYLLALYYKMLAGIEGYTLTTDDKRDIELRDSYSKLRNGKLKEKRFPVGTDSGTFEKYTFDLCQSYEKIMSFDWIDYAGGDLGNKVGAYEQLEQDIYESSSLFIFVDGANIIKDFQTGEELEDIDERIESVSLANASINNLLARYSQRKEKDNFFPPIAIVITKYDLFHDLVSEDELCKIVQEAFSPLFGSKANKIERIITIIPISLGANISDNDYSGKLKPININLPILFGIYFTIVKQQFAQHCESIYSFMEKFGKEKQKYSDSRNERIEKLTSERDSELARLEKYRKDEVARLEKTHRDEVSKLERESKRKLSDLEDELDSEVSRAKEEGNSKIKKLQSDSDNEIARLARSRDSQISDLANERDSTLSGLRSERDSQISDYNSSIREKEKKNSNIFSKGLNFLGSTFGNAESYESQISDLKYRRDSYSSRMNNQIESVRNSANMEIENVKNSANANINNEKNRASREIQTAQSNMERKIEQVISSRSKEIDSLKSSTARKIDSIHRDSEQKIQDVKTTTSENINNVKIQAEKDIKDVDNAIKRDIEKLSVQTDDDIKKIKQMREDLHLYTDNLIPSLEVIPRWYRFAKDSAGCEEGSFKEVMDKYVNISDDDLEKALKESSKVL